MYDTYQTTTTAYGKDWHGSYYGRPGVTWSPGIPNKTVKITCKRAGFYTSEVGNCYCEAEIVEPWNNPRDKEKCSVYVNSSNYVEPFRMGDISQTTAISCNIAFLNTEGKMASNNRIFAKAPIYCPLLAGQIELKPKTNPFPLIFGKTNTTPVFANSEVLFSTVTVSRAILTRGQVQSAMTGKVNKGTYYDSYSFVPTLDNKD